MKSTVAILENSKLHQVDLPETESRELKNIDHHHPESKKRKSSEGNSGSIRPYGRYENAGKPSKTISTIAILWPVKAIVEKRAATVEVDTFISPGVQQAHLRNRYRILLQTSIRKESPQLLAKPLCRNVSGILLHKFGGFCRGISLGNLSQKNENPRKTPAAQK